ncbi:prepilin-type N-terminal cleavage/methylation domain-containing protein [Selenihalanaerobacter shriftii]|uniref:General secretion pathway protein G n=1 Tax=Selenihalanaerobacter shriftii TaxID=142842 RepID=A0A1T4P4X0_9FIRM|nr:prepilin-type N-terminal cleavage/methylation domain-containing protein [Selenihalanaerobacter shriftii]SJZ86306.1 general secretion pathway protein G [Selenihalanaerobacter shriftii]
MIKKIRERLSFLAEGEEGFTLIELMIVIAVLGILAGIAIPKLGGVQDKAKEAALTTMGGTIRTGMEMYNAQEGDYPTVNDGRSISNFSELASALSVVGVDLEAPDVLDTSTSTGTGTGITYNADDDQYLIVLPSTASSTIYYVGDQGVSTTTGDATSGGAVN